MKKIIFALMMIFSLSAVNICNAATFDRAFYRGNMNLNYPVVILNDVNAAAKINNEIRGEVTRFVMSMEQTAADNDYTITALGIDYQITCNQEGGLLSVVLTEFVNFKMAAHPSTFKRGLNFNTSTGDRIFAYTLTEIDGEEFGEPAYSPNNLTRKLFKYANDNGIGLYRDFQNLTAIPEDFYFDNDLHVHFILQQYEVAPYAVGIIEFDATTGY